MKTALIILFFLIVALITAGFILGIISRSKKAPGLAAGHLSRCPDKPNCVCSEQKDDANHFIAPLSIPQSTILDTGPTLINSIRDMGGHIQAESDTYIAATFSSALFGFVDDLEIRIDPAQKVIHIRSGSRVGYGDAGVNRKRAESLKKLYNMNILKPKSLNAPQKNSTN